MRTFCLFLLLPGLLLAQESPVKTLRSVVKATVGAESWRAELTVQGAIATGPTHAMGNHDIDERYILESAGELCRIVTPHAYRRAFAKSGALETEDGWTALANRLEGRALGALARPVLEVLAAVLELRAEAAWVDGPLHGFETVPEGRHLRVEGTRDGAIARFSDLQKAGLFEDPRNFEGPSREQEHIPGVTPPGGNWIVPEIVERLDRSRGKIVYDLILDAELEHVEVLQVSVLFAHTGTPAQVAPDDALSEASHIAVIWTYRLSELGQVTVPAPPRAARKFLR